MFAFATRLEYKELDQKVDLLTERVFLREGVYDKLYEESKNIKLWSDAILAGLLVVLGVFIESRYKRILSMKEAIDSAKKVMSKTSEEFKRVEGLALASSESCKESIKTASEERNKVEELKKEIEDFLNDKSGEFYKRIRHEEDRSLLQRLVEEPNDIENIGNILLGRKINPVLFPVFEQACENLGSKLEKKNSIADYISLAIQHFPLESLKSGTIYPFLSSNFRQSHVNCMFLPDIKSFIPAVIEFSKEDKGLILNKTVAYIYKVERFKNNPDQSFLDPVKEYKASNPSVLFEEGVEADLLTLEYKEWVSGL